MKNNKNNALRNLAVWDKPELSVLDADLDAIESARNAGSDGGNGRSSSGS